MLDLGIIRREYSMAQTSQSAEKMGVVATRIPDLIAEVERLRAENDELVDAVRQMVKMFTYDHTGNERLVALGNVAAIVAKRKESDDKA